MGMDLRYCVSHRADPDGPIHKWNSVCTVSSESVLAFSRVCSVPSDSGSKVMHCVAAADLNAPYKTTDIVQCSDAILLLRFSIDGRQLLVVTAAGKISLYKQVSGALQPDWALVAETAVRGETVLAASFLHNGLKPQINLGETKVNSLYNEKFSLLSHTPSLVGPGYCAADGVLAVTASGLVVVMAVWRPGVVEVVREVLGPARGHLSTADISMGPDGSIVVSAWQPDVVRCWRLRLSHAVVALADRTQGGTTASGQDAVNMDFVSEDSKLQLSVDCCESLCPCRPASTAPPSTAPLSADGAANKLGRGKEGTIEGASPLGPLRELRPECYRVGRVHFPYHEDPTLLLVVLVERPPPDTGGHDGAKGGTGGSLRSHCHVVQKYRLEEKTQPVLRLFKTATDAAAPAPTTVTSYKVWTLQGEWCSTGGGVVNIGSCQRHLFLSSQLPHLITVATEDANITSINLHNMMQVGIYNLNNARHSDHNSGEDGSGGRGGSGNKGRGQGAAGGVSSGLVGGATSHDSSYTGQATVSLVHTWTGLSLVSYSGDGTLCLFSLIKPVDIGNLWPLCVLLLLEYSIVSGHDWWELLINTPPSSVTTVVDRMLDTLSLHSSSLNTHHHTRMLLLRYAILRLSTSTQQRATEAMLQAHLSAILNLCRQFRPVSVDCNPDKCASNMLTVYLENRSSMDQLDLDKSVDQFLFSVNQSLDCQVEQRLGRYLQPLVQYTAEVALYLLFMMAQGNKNDLLREMKTVQQLREILFRARVWYRHNKLVAPHIIRKMDTVDVWAQLYRLLTRLLAALPGDPDASFIDEVVLLETQVLSYSLSLSLPSRGFFTTMHTAPSLPVSVQPPPPAQHNTTQYQHGHEDEQPPLSHYQLEGALPPPNPRDPLFLHFIPNNANKLQCSRCWAVRSVEHDLDSPWEQQWSARCLCSGHWLPDPLSAAPHHLLA